MHVTARRGRAPRRRGVVGYSGPQRAPELLHGFAVSPPADTWCELAAISLPNGKRLTLDQLIAAGDRLVGWPDPLATIEAIDESLARHTAARGIRILRLARRELRAGSASPRETRLRLLATRARPQYPTPELNGVITLSDGSTTPGDLVYRARRVLLEYDGEQHRTNQRQFLRDVDRVNALTRDGWRVIRVHRHTPDATVLALLDAAMRADCTQPHTSS